MTPILQKCRSAPIHNHKGVAGIGTAASPYFQIHAPSKNRRDFEAERPSGPQIDH